MADPVDDVQRWVTTWVVGHGLCPFAKAVLPRTTWVLVDDPGLGPALHAMLDAIPPLLDATPAPDATTLLVLPHAPRDFDTFLDWNEAADAVLDDAGLRGTIQLASFHPAWTFGDLPPGDPGHAVNRAPHPVWHLLREDDVARAIASHPDPEGIPDRNRALLRRLASS